MSLDLAIIGAGPYGLSVAAHLRKAGLSFRIFGSPMQSWRRHMPKGMHLKSEGFASSLYDPDGVFSLSQFCREKNLPYADIGLPTPIETFIAYGLEFQKRYVPMLEETDVTILRRAREGFELETAASQSVLARRVIVATGLSYFARLPGNLAGLPRRFVTHSSEHHDLTRFEGKNVAVIGAGASALDLAALLHEAGAHVTVTARASRIGFHSLMAEPRPLWQRIRNPRSGLGVGWRSRLATDAPLLFHFMPQEFRLRIVRTHLGPAPGWFIRSRVEGRVPMHIDTEVESASVNAGKARLQLRSKEGSRSELVADHVIAATGYSVSVSKLSFLDESLRRGIECVEDSPILSTNFQTSVPGLYMVGLASANSFGPLVRFAYGAGFTARRITHHLASTAKVSPAPMRSDFKKVLRIDL
jgi:cation diffusion facilitator CzcD-associated flavoprotein CzcO